MILRFPNVFETCFIFFLFRIFLTLKIVVLVIFFSSFCLGVLAQQEHEAIDVALDEYEQETSETLEFEVVEETSMADQAMTDEIIIDSLE